MDPSVAALPGTRRSRAVSGLVGPAYGDWVREQVCSDTSISVRQHVQLSKHTRP